MLERQYGAQSGILHTHFNTERTRAPFAQTEQGTDAVTGEHAEDIQEQACGEGNTGHRCQRIPVECNDHGAHENNKGGGKSREEMEERLQSGSVPRFQRKSEKQRHNYGEQDAAKHFKKRDIHPGACKKKRQPRGEDGTEQGGYRRQRYGVGCVRFRNIAHYVACHGAGRSACQYQTDQQRIGQMQQLRHGKSAERHDGKLSDNTDRNRTGGAQDLFKILQFQCRSDPEHGQCKIPVHAGFQE